MAYRFTRRRGVGGRPALRESERRGVLLGCRLSPEEAEGVRDAAEKAGVSVSDYIRTRLAPED